MKPRDGLNLNLNLVYFRAYEAAPPKDEAANYSKMHLNHLMAEFFFSHLATCKNKII